MADDSAIKLKITRLFFTTSLAVVLAATIAAAAGSTPWALVAVAVVALGFASWYAIGFVARRGWPASAFLALGVVNLVIVAPEVALRAIDFHYESGIQFGFPNPTQFVRYDTDEKLFWKMKAGAPNVNSWGFPGREPRIPKPRGLYRMLFLGDSCTMQGYPSFVEALMNTGYHGKGPRYEAMALAVAGYSSHQGRVLAELHGDELEPDAVFVYFGWNDHWRAYGAVDSEKVMRGAGKPAGPAGKLVKKAYENARVLQGVNKLLSRKHDVEKPLEALRVPEATYRENLLAILRVFQKKSVPVVFITAPTAMYELGVPDYLLELHFADNPEEVTTLHRRYNQIVREVAREPGAKLLDLEAYFEEQKGLKPLFIDDRIHFTNPGMGVVARRIADFSDAELIKP